MQTRGKTGVSGKVPVIPDVSSMFLPFVLDRSFIHDPRIGCSHDKGSCHKTIPDIPSSMNVVSCLATRTTFRCLAAFRCVAALNVVRCIMLFLRRYPDCIPLSEWRHTPLLWLHSSQLDRFQLFFGHIPRSVFGTILRTS